MENKKNRVFMTFMMSFMVFLSCFGAFSVYAASFEYSKLTETLLNQDPDPAEPGDYVELRFKVEKEGNELIEDIEYELVPEYPFSFDNSDKAVKSLGNWIGNSDDEEYYTLYYKLKVSDDALEGVYDLTLVQRSSSSPVEREIEFDVRVEKKSSPEIILGNVETLPKKLIANFDEGTLKVEIVNIGDEAAEQVIVDLNLPEGFDESFGYSTRANLGTIGAGESKIASFYVDTNEGLAKGNHESQLHILYKEDDENSDDVVNTLDVPFDIKVFGRPEYKVLSTNVSELFPGSLGGTIDIKIQNIGSRESDSTSIQVFKDSSQPFEFDEKSVFIGKLDTNEEGEAVFKLDIKEDAIPKEYRLKLQVRSVVDDDVLVEDKVIIINVNQDEKPKAGENIFIRYVIYAFCLLGGFVFGNRFGKRKSVVKKK